MYPTSTPLPEFIKQRITQMIDTLHDAGIVHGDLHRENIVIDTEADGAITDIKIIDFGLAFSTDVLPGDLKTRLKHLQAGQKSKIPKKENEIIEAIKKYDFAGWV